MLFGDALGLRGFREEPSTLTFPRLRVHRSQGSSVVDSL